MRPDIAAALSLAVTMTFVSIAVLRLIDINEKEPVWALGLLIWLGVVSAGAAAVLTSQHTGHETSVRIVLTADIAKVAAIGVGMALLAGMARLRGFSDVNGIVDSLIYGAAAGAGFAVGDTFLRETLSTAQEMQTPVQTGTLDLIWISLQSGLSEALFGAIIGAGVGIALEARSRVVRLLLPLAGLAAAVLVHLGYVSVVLDSPPIGPGFSLASALAALALATAVAAAVLYGLRSERHTILAELAAESDNRVITAAELDRFARPAERRRQYVRKFLAGDLDAWLLQRRLQDRQVQLALTRRRLHYRPETVQLAAEAERLREVIRRMRATAERLAAQTDPSDPARSGARTRVHPRALATAALALGIVLGGAAIVAVASGDQAPTTIATRRSQFEREVVKSSRHDSQLVLRERMSQFVGGFVLSRARRDNRLVAGGAREAYRLDYRGESGHRVRYSLALYRSPARAETEGRRLLAMRPDERRAWVNGRILSATAGKPADLDEFCNEVPADRRPDHLPGFRAAMAAALPASWTDKSSDRSISLDENDSQANILGSEESYGGTSRTYADLSGQSLGSEFPRYRQLSYAPIALGPRRTALRRQYEWTPNGGERVRQVQVYFVDCGIGYVFTATTRARDFQRFALVINRILAALATAS